MDLGTSRKAARPMGMSTLPKRPVLHGRGPAAIQTIP